MPEVVISEKSPLEFWVLALPWKIVSKVTDHLLSFWLSSSNSVKNKRISKETLSAKPHWWLILPTIKLVQDLGKYYPLNYYGFTILKIIFNNKSNNIYFMFMKSWQPVSWMSVNWASKFKNSPDKRWGSWNDGVNIQMRTLVNFISPAIHHLTGGSYKNRSRGNKHLKSLEIALRI